MSGKTRNTGYLQNIIQYDENDNIILPSLIGVGTRMVVANALGLMSTQTIPSISSLGGLSGSGTANYLLKYTGSNTTGVSRIQDDGAGIGLGGVPVSGYAVYLHTDINDGSFGIDSSASINALYLLKSGTKNFEISYDTSGSNKIFRLLPYQSTSFFQIGNPSNAGNDYVFVAESTYGNVLIGPGLANGNPTITGATASIHKIQLHGKTFVDDSIQASSFVKTSGTSSQFLKADGSVDTNSYLTSFTETDPIFVASPAHDITNTQISHWDTSYGWGDHSTYSYATQTYVGTAIANLIDTAPGTLDTLNELAAALGDDPNFATSVATSIGTKEPIITAGTTSQYWRGDKTWQTLPIYTLSGLGGVPTTRTITINGTALDLSADRSFTINSMVYPGAGIAVSTGTAWGTSITDNSTNWNTAYGWGNHASAGYLTTSSAASTYVSLTGSYANPSWITSLAYSKITGVPAFLTSYTETDPYRVTSVAVTGTSTKTITITRADASTVTTTWTDIDTDTNTYVTSAAFSGGTLTLTRNDAATVSVSLDGRYYLATNPSGYITGITSANVTTALGYTPYNGATNPNGYITGVTNITGYAAMLNTSDTRTISPSSHTSYRLTFGFTSWANNSTADWADFLHLRSYGDGSGGADNLITFKKNGIGMRIWQQAFGSATAYSSYVDVYHSGNLTNLNQLTNGPGYITGYTETDTLASVTGRGATTSSKVYFTYHTNSDPLSAVEINGGGTHSGLYINPAASSQAHIRFGTNGTLKWQIRAPFQDSVNTDLKLYSWVNAADQFTFSHTGIFSIANKFVTSLSSGTMFSHGSMTDAIGYNGSYGTYIGSSVGGTYYLYANGTFYDAGTIRTLIHSGNIGSQTVSTASAQTTLYYNGSTRLYTGSDGTRNTGWAYHTDNGTGVHWPNNGWHIYPKNASDMYWRSGASDSSIAFLRNGSQGNYVHNASDNAIGFLSTGRSWIFRVDDSGNATATNDLTCNSLNTGNYINIGYNRNNESISTSSFRGIDWHTQGDFNYYIGKPAGGWTQPLHIHFYTGIRLRSHSSYGGSQFFNISGSVTTATINDGDNHMRGYYDIIAYASDKRLKHNIQPIENALSKVISLTGMTYQWNEIGAQHGWEPDTETREAGVFAQDVQAVLPEAVKLAPFDQGHDEHGNSISKSGQNFLTVKYEKIVPLLIEAIKEQQKQIESQKIEIDELKDLVKQLINR